MAKYRGDEDRDFVQSNFNTECVPTINVIKGGKATKPDHESGGPRRRVALRRSSGSCTVFAGVKIVYGDGGLAYVLSQGLSPTGVPRRRPFLIPITKDRL